MLCPNCKTDNDIKNKFCSRCGASLSEVQHDELLQEQSRQIAMRSQRSTLQIWEQAVNQQLPRYKYFPLLTTLKIVLLLCGFLLIISSCVGTIISLNLSDNAFRDIDSLLNINTDIYRVILAAVFGAWFPVGLGLITLSELISVALNVSENSDRQSMYLLMLYNRSRKVEP